MTKQIIAGVKWLRFWDRDSDNRITFSGDVWPNIVMAIYTVYVGVMIAIHWIANQVPSDFFVGAVVFGSLGTQFLKYLTAAKNMNMTKEASKDKEDEHKPPGIDSY